MFNCVETVDKISQAYSAIKMVGTHSHDQAVRAPEKFLNEQNYLHRTKVCKHVAN
jgi:hypothetical protein